MSTPLGKHCEEGEEGAISSPRHAALPPAAGSPGACSPASPGYLLFLQIIPDGIIAIPRFLL